MNMKPMSLEEMECMALFAELPDLDEMLFLHHHHDLTTFTCFPSLPIEIRLGIFRLTFPEGRTIYLRTRRLRQTLGEFYRMIQTGSDYPSITAPIGLFINHESRVETLRSYMVVHKLNPGEEPFFFNPTRDTFYLELWDLCRCITHEPELLEWLHIFRERNPVLFLKITNLEVGNWLWTRALETCIEKDFGLKILTLFPALAKLELRKRISHGIERLPRMSNRIEEEMLDLLGRFLERHKSVWNGRVPTVEYIGRS